MNVKELTQSQQQSQDPNAHKKKPTIRLTTRFTMLWAPQRSLLYRLLVLDEVKCKTHTQQSIVEFRGLPPLIPLLQCGNRLGLEICSVN